MAMRIDALRELLSAKPTGPIEETRDLADVLASCWSQLRGSGAEGTTSAKVRRIEKVNWDPPILSFVLERHGGLQMGGTRAETHQWKVDVRAGTAEIAKTAWRQKVGMAERWSAGPAAKEIAEHVIAGTAHPALKFRKDGTIGFNLSCIVPSSVNQTTAGRRRRFRPALEELVAPHGWEPTGLTSLRRWPEGE